MSIIKVREAMPDNDPAVVGLTAHYHNLLRHWSDV